MDRGAWQAAVHRAAKSQTRLKQRSTRVPSIGGDVEQSELSLLVGKRINTTALGFPGQQVGTESVCSAGDLGSIPGSGRSPGGGNGNPLQYSFLENPMDRGAWQATVHGITKSQT